MSFASKLTATQHFVKLWNEGRKDVVVRAMADNPPQLAMLHAVLLMKQLDPDEQMIFLGHLAQGEGAATYGSLDGAVDPDDA